MMAALRALKKKICSQKQQTFFIASIAQTSQEILTFLSVFPRTRCSQNRRQKVVNRGALRLCGGSLRSCKGGLLRDCALTTAKRFTLFSEKAIIFSLRRDISNLGVFSYFLAVKINPFATLQPSI